MCEFGSNCERNGVEYHLGTKSGYRFVANKNSSKIEFDGTYYNFLLTQFIFENPLLCVSNCYSLYLFILLLLLTKRNNCILT